MIFCGIFDGHGPWGHFVAKRVRELVPASLLCHWQETLAATSLDLNFKMEADRSLHRFETWKQSYLKTCASVDQYLKQHTGIDTFRSGATALTVTIQVIQIYVIQYLLSFGIFDLKMHKLSLCLYDRIWIDVINK